MAPRVLSRRGCRAGRRRASGLVIVAFGKQLYNGHSYGTLTFRNRFASDRTITRALAAYARGYARCLPKHSRASIWLARGTSNYAPAVPSTYRSGRRWTRETVRLARYLRSHGLSRQVRAAAAIDAERSWDSTFRSTRAFFRGYQAYRSGYPLYSYRSLRSGDAFVVGMPGGTSGPLRGPDDPARRRLPLRPPAPHEAHRALVRALGRHLRTRVEKLPAVTNIRWPA